MSFRTRSRTAVDGRLVPIIRRSRKANSDCQHTTLKGHSTSPLSTPAFRLRTAIREISLISYGSAYSKAKPCVASFHLERNSMRRGVH
jgi:hypothetical protein